VAAQLNLADADSARSAAADLLRTCSTLMSATQAAASKASRTVSTEAAHTASSPLRQQSDLLPLQSCLRTAIRQHPGLKPLGRTRPAAQAVAGCIAELVGSAAVAGVSAAALHGTAADGASASEAVRELQRAAGGCLRRHGASVPLERLAGTAADVFTTEMRELRDCSMQIQLPLLSARTTQSGPDAAAIGHEMQPGARTPTSTADASSGASTAYASTADAGGYLAMLRQLLFDQQLPASASAAETGASSQGFDDPATAWRIFAAATGLLQRLDLGVGSATRVVAGPANLPGTAHPVAAADRLASCLFCGGEVTHLDWQEHAPKQAAAGPAATSADQTAELPVSLLIDGVAGCWARGSGPDISSDYLYRGVYANQVARLAAHIPPVSCCRVCGLCVCTTVAQRVLHSHVNSSIAGGGLSLEVTMSGGVWRSPTGRARFCLPPTAIIVPV